MRPDPPRRPRLLARAALFTLLALASSLPGYGPFKQRTEDLRWRILTTPHFEIYHYPEEEGLARRGAVVAERALAHNSKVLDYYTKARIPLFLYQSHLDFQQTSISREVIGPGTGGFTEAFKNRMVLPTMQSDRWLDVVITHELAHALQFNILYGEGARSFQVFKNYVIPLWVMEGIAEYCAQNWDSFADMVLRDAVINERVPDLDMLDGFSHLDEVYVAYKAGQTAVQYLADTYGPDSVAKLMKKYKAQISTGQIMRDLTGKSFGRFNREWKASLRQKYWLQAKGRRSAGDYGTALTTDTSEHPTLNNGPAWSPDGRRIAFVTTRENREEIWVMQANGKEPEALFSGPFEELGRSGAYGVPGNRLSWFPDGTRLAFIRVRDGAKRLCIGEVASGALRDLDLPYREIESPAVSPDGKRIAFAAAQDGRTQIYTYALEDGALAQATSETASLVVDPAWSPDGKRLAYSVEEEKRNRVVVLDLESRQRRVLSPEGHDCLMPAFSQDGKKLYYVSDERGPYNLVMQDLDSQGRELATDVVTGLFNPRLSPDGSQLAVVAYEDGCQNLYRMPAPGFVKAPPPPGLRALMDPYRWARGASPTADARTGELDAMASVPEPPAEALAAISATAEPAAPPSEHLLKDAASEPAPLDISATASLPVRPYTLDVTPDLFFLLLGYESAYGLVGGGYLTASDMLGEHNFSAWVNFVPGYQSVVQADYLLYRGNVSASLAAFYRNTNYFLTSINPQTLNSTFVDQDWGAMLAFQYPLSKFTRLDWGLGSRRLYRQLNGQAVLDPELAATLGDSVINGANLGLVRNTMTYQNYDLYRGYHLSYGLSYADKVLGGTRNFVTHQLDARFALPLSFLSRDTVLTGRALGLEQSGADRQVFYFGGQFVRGLSYNEYLGSKLAVGNLQLRQPYLKRIDGTLWPFESLLIKDTHLVFFYDVGAAPASWEGLQATDVRAGYGGGLRLHTFLFQKVFLLWAFDLGQRTDRPGATYYYFTLGQIF